MDRFKTSLIVFMVAVLTVPVAAATASSDVNRRYTAPSQLANAVQFGGYHEFEYEDIENSPGDFDQHRTILFFGAQPHERIRFFNELEIEHGGHPDVKLEQSWLEFSINENHNFRGGIDLIPVGRKNIYHDGNLRDFVFRPFTDDRLIPTTWFEAGLGFNGDLTETLNYQIGVSNGMVPVGGSSVGTRGELDMAPETGGNAVDENDANGSKALWGRFAFSPALGTEIALSGYQTTYSQTRDRDITFIALDFNHIQGPWEFTGEYVDIDKDQQVATEPSNLDPDGDGRNELLDSQADFNGNGTLGDSIRGLSGADGGYLEAAYHFFPEGWYDSWFARGFDNPTFTALARYEQLNYDEPSGATELDEDYVSLGFNYRPLEAVAIKTSYDIENRDAAGAVENDRFGFGTVIGF